jgi:hypothetical protein
MKLKHISTSAIDEKRVLGKEHLDTLESIHQPRYVPSMQETMRKLEIIHRQVLEAIGKVFGREQSDSLESTR